MNPLYYREAQLVGSRSKKRRGGAPGLLPFSSATLWRMVADGRFPKPLRLADRITAWSAESVDAWRAEHRA